MSVRLIVITGTSAVGKSTFATKLAARLGGPTPVFHIDDYIPRPPPPGYASDWAHRRVGYLPEIGGKVRDALRDARVAIFEGVLTSDLEVPTLARFSGLSGEEVLVVVINRPLSDCWDRKGREDSFRKQYPFIQTAADFARFFYNGYQPVGVSADLTLTGAEVDGDLGAERVARRLSVRG